MKIATKKFYKLTSWSNVIKLFNGDYIAIGITSVKLKRKYVASVESYADKKFCKLTSENNVTKLFLMLLRGYWHNLLQIKNEIH